MVRTALLVVIMIMLLLCISCISFCALRMQESYSLRFKAFSAL